MATSVLKSFMEAVNPVAGKAAQKAQILKVARPRGKHSLRLKLMSCFRKLLKTGLLDLR